MESTILDNIGRILREGGKLKITSRKGVDLDITTEMKSTIIDISIIEKTYVSSIQEKENKIKQLAEENILLKKDLKRMNKYKKLFEDYDIKMQLYKDSFEGKLIERLKSRNIKSFEDINAVLKKYEDEETYHVETESEKIERKFAQDLMKEKKEDESSKVRLDMLVEEFKRKIE